MTTGAQRSAMRYAARQRELADEAKRAVEFYATGPGAALLECATCSGTGLRADGCCACSTCQGNGLERVKPRAATCGHAVYTSKHDGSLEHCVCACLHRWTMVHEGLTG